MHELVPGHAQTLVVCAQCSAVLYLANQLGVDRRLALTVAAPIVFVIANVCPVIRISLPGLHSETTLWRSAAALAHGTVAPIAIAAAMMIVVVPLLQIALLGWVLAFARAARRAPGLAWSMRLLATLSPWRIVEGCVSGMLANGSIRNRASLFAKRPPRALSANCFCRYHAKYRGEKSSISRRRSDRRKGQSYDFAR
ncbi:paraquat-inducible protein A [Paraburkholderia sp. RAU2J]|uniref:paraquat-inducible protein A n=1 Tax=Paraburkholderia sp. RAU2J TaxID=1938810 RepID=UPI000EAFBAA5|nr:paraquat-inducible protein A [Paraburkholderia sp. RAU2J]RKT27528.1 paraquat-inducible protein A [Paraburkholderia sp. RAU2J]